MHDVSRRQFLSHSATAAAGAAVVPSLLSQSAAAADATSPANFSSTWVSAPDRIWIGPEYWSNPLQDWRLAGGRLECVNGAADRHVHLLTRSVEPGAGNLELRVRVGRVEGGPLGAGGGSVGFRVGNKGRLSDYRNALIFGSGLRAGLTSQGGLFVGEPRSARSGTVDLNRPEVELRLRAEATEAGCRLTLSAHDPADGALLGEVVEERLPADQLVGGVALVCNFGAAGGGPGTRQRGGQQPPAGNAGRFWFADWRVSGSLLARYDERAFGPILFTQYTLHNGVLKLTAQMPPLGPQDTPHVRLDVQRDGAWQAVAEAGIHPDARTAEFRVENWDASRDVPYRVVYALRNMVDGASEHTWTGVVRRDPTDKPVLTVADISCNIHSLFPNVECVASMARLDPDVLAFTGDQFYEGSGGYGVVRGPADVAIVDMLRKWYLHGWTWRELMRDRPSISIPDDHDVYHGNLWGEGGEAVQPGATIEAGGYTMAPEFVNAVHRTQTSHHPDFPDPAPGKRNISVYFGSLTYGGVSFAIVADRQFKSAPEGKVPPTGGRADHVTDPNFDPATVDLPGLELLGERQERFLEQWAEDWRGADMKAVVSQTIFTAMATTHGGGRDRLRADYDANGWPQTGRNTAVRAMRRACAFHLAGDQHLPAVVQYGLDGFRDGPYAFAGPAVNVGYPRWFEPESPGLHRAEGAADNTGDFLDSFGNRLTVLAVANPRETFRSAPYELEIDKSSGFGVVRFDKRARTVTVECWPLLADPLQEGTQMPGWPVTVPQLELPAAAQLPKLHFEGGQRPVVQVIDESTGELVYTVRAPEWEWQPAVFGAGPYTVRYRDDATGRWGEVRHLLAAAGNPARLNLVV